VDTGDERLLALAEQLLAAYRPDPPPTRAEIAEALLPVVSAFSDRKLAKGIEKLLQDRSEFSHDDQADCPGLRRQLFATSAGLLREARELDCELYRRQVLARAGLPEDAAERDIYSDLPANETLVRFRDLSPRETLERYNVALVQSLLLRAGSLELILASPEPAKLRRLFKYLKFFRLLARTYRVETSAAQRKEHGDAIRLVIDGPESIFAGSKRYGLQLASFFPAVCSLERWRLEADVEWRGRTLGLRLTEKSGLVSHYRNLGAYVPEEIRMFHDLFERTVRNWRIVGGAPFLDTGDQELIFPDLSFRNDGGALVHLELFHRWHATPLLSRLELIERRPDLPLIVGVDRTVYRKPEIRAALDGSDWFEQHGFLFRDYPPVARVAKCLARTAASNVPDLPLWQAMSDSE